MYLEPAGYNTVPAAGLLIGLIRKGTFLCPAGILFQNSLTTLCPFPATDGYGLMGKNDIVFDGDKMNSSTTSTKMVETLVISSMSG